MQFIDRITIKVTAGTGGHGKSAFRREKFVARAAPLVVMVAVAVILFFG